MIRLINRDTGGETWVHESRLEEYLKAGHRLAPAPKIEADARPLSRCAAAPLTQGSQETRAAEGVGPCKQETRGAKTKKGA